MSKAARAGFAFLLILAVAGPLAAADAGDWLARLAERAEKGHYKVRMLADVSMVQEGMQAAVKMDGTMNYASAEKFKLDLDMSMDMGGMAMNMAMKTVADGTDFWLEIDSPMMGGKQVMTGKTAELKQLSEMGGMGAFGGMGADPMAQMTAMAEQLDLQVQSVEGGRVTLHADITPEKLAGLGDLAELGDAINYITFVLDEKEAVLLQVKMGAEQPFMTMDMSDYEFFDASDVEDSDYTYTVPEGVPVNDIGAMLGAGQ